RFRTSFYDKMQKKLGTEIKGEPGEKLVDTTLELLAAESVDFTRFFRFLTQIAGGEDAEEKFAGEFNNRELAGEWLQTWKELTNGTPNHSGMAKVNPVVIPRNHRIEEVIRTATSNGDLSPFHQLLERVTKPFDECDAEIDYEAAPSAEEIVSRTFCGT
ncbi:MAG: protein adenylyltransferase SelO family protein, partial [Verrucomicrobiales bacterium]|nr:protein adenylyltransferase SelO family protein [Verrucomicrobiales bacterium]